MPPSDLQVQTLRTSGIPVSELFPKTAENVDELCIIRSMQADVPTMNISNVDELWGWKAHPSSMGSWVTYGLGTENRPTRLHCNVSWRLLIKESQNWTSAFLPGVYQGTYIDSKDERRIKILENIRNSQLNPQQQRQQLNLLQTTNYTLVNVMEMLNWKRVSIHLNWLIACRWRQLMPLI